MLLVLPLDNGDYITNLYDIANTFNDNFASIAETTKSNIKYSHKHFSDYLKNEYDSAIFLQLNSKEEIAYTISSLNSTKASGLSSMSFVCRFIQSFFISGIFPLVLKTANVIPIFKKNSKLDYSNYHPISLFGEGNLIFCCTGATDPNFWEIKIIVILTLHKNTFVFTIYFSFNMIFFLSFTIK